MRKLHVVSLGDKLPIFGSDGMYERKLCLVLI